jgi:hypothetical protein
MQIEKRRAMERRAGAERRSGEDRRSWLCNLDFPYVDSHGTLVTQDRRKVAERRIAFLDHSNGDRRNPMN